MSKLDIHSQLDNYISNLLKEEERPNILLLFTDQQRFDTINACGFSHMHTPHLDKLAKDGRVYTHAFSPNPICCPARHNLITGLTAKHHGLADNEFNGRCNRALPTVAELLSDAGYATIAIGKMHFQPARRHNGFERFESMEEVPNYREDDDYLKFLQENGFGHVQNIHGVRNLLYMSPQQSVLPEHLLGTKWVADRTIHFIKNHSKKRPFFAFSGFIAPHPPLNTPPSMQDLYKDADLPKPLEAKSSLPELTIENNAWADFPTEESRRRTQECYYTQISYIDEQVGEILKALKETGQEENTLIIFTSDHGEMLGDLGCYQKFLPYDGSSRIPFIVKYPKKVTKGEVCSDYVDLNDILPTFLDAANVEYPCDYDLPGESLIATNVKKDRSYQYVEYSRGSRRWVSLRNKKYEYNYYYGGGKEELFDLEQKDGEAYNLLEHEPSTFEAIRCSLRAKLIAYEKRYGLDGYIKDDDFICLDKYVANPCRNSAFPVYPKTENNPEKSHFYEEVLKAVEHEPSVNLKKLDIKTFLTHKNLPKEGLHEFLKIVKEE